MFSSNSYFLKVCYTSNEERLHYLPIVLRKSQLAPYHGWQICDVCYCVMPPCWKQHAISCLGCIILKLQLLRYICEINDYIYFLSTWPAMYLFHCIPLNPILCGTRFIAIQQAAELNILVMNMACHLCLSCEVGVQRYLLTIAVLNRSYKRSSTGDSMYII